MKENRKYRIFRKAIPVTTFAMLAQVFMPTMSWALTSGPSQPEFSSFEPVSSNNMVNDFTGDFTYNLPVLNVPGPNGSGYPLSLSYHSGVSPEEEASWVGYGWTLNPGAINRSKHGFADDANGSLVKYWNKRPKNWTASLGMKAEAEGFSFGLGFKANAAIRYNNYNGFSKDIGLGASFMGVMEVGLRRTDQKVSFSVNPNPTAILNYAFDKNFRDDFKEAMNPVIREECISDEITIQAAKDGTENFKKKMKLEANSGFNRALGSVYKTYSRAGMVRASSTPLSKGRNYHLNVGFMITPSSLEIGIDAGLTGSYAYQENVNHRGTAGFHDAVKGYGYFYQGNVEQSVHHAGMMDYYTERLTNYRVQEKYLGIPFSNSDDYLVTGEGIGGAFRGYTRTIGTYSPNYAESVTKQIGGSLEIEAGFNLGGGAGANLGIEIARTLKWKGKNEGHYSTLNSDEDESVFFRFNGDLGGNVSHDPGYLSIASMGVLGYDAGRIGKSTQGKRIGRSSYISYHTNDEMSEVLNGKLIYADNKLNNNHVDREDEDIKSQIGEFTVFNEDGTRYNYGLPVFSKKEKTLSYGVQGVSAADVKNNHLVYQNINRSNYGKINTILGEESDEPYATAYLLTELTTPDYIDRTFDGVSDDDLGGYTKFEYNQIYGSENKTGRSNWFKWRIPYTGLRYRKGEISTTRDDLGTVSSGEKEVYYLNKIETKTHYAKFITSDRNDGMEAAGHAESALSESIKGSKKLQKLDKIELYVKNSDGTLDQLLKTVHFEYAADLDALSQGVTNSATGGGKLTLRKVWTESRGVKNVKISPYVFGYEYSNVDYPKKYDALENYGNGKIENPIYSAFSTGAWGNYQSDGENRHQKMQTWLNQLPEDSFDPAAWQLKTITLPTGAEIHVQYEQDDYQYVQDRKAHALIRLKEGTNEDRFYLNTEDFGIEGNVDLKDQLKKLIQNEYVDGKKKMYFRFLYALRGEKPAISKCNSEFITGYVDVKKVGHDTNGVYVEFGAKTGNNHPKKVCKQFYKSHRKGNIDVSGNCDASATGIPENGDPEKIILSLLNYVEGFVVTNVCKELSQENSYLKVPLPIAKKGGGLRVKRLLMYDAPISSNGSAELYGTEYHYVNTDGKSSGVATNEPGGMREENPLVEFDYKQHKNFNDFSIFGKKKDDTELPLGESIIAGPSVGYSRIVSQNIHTGLTDVGYAIKEYYTAKNYPFKAQFTRPLTFDAGLDTGIKKENFAFNVDLSNLSMTQGYRFEKYSMHGVVKSEGTYAGDINSGSIIPTGMVKYEYFQPNETMPVMDKLGLIYQQKLGVESEIAMEARSTENVAGHFASEFDIDLGVFPLPLVFGSFAPKVSFVDHNLKTHVTSKVVTYPAVIKKRTAFVDGIYNITENIAFDPRTGQPVVTKSYDGYDKLDLEKSASHDGEYITYSTPASRYYKNVRSKALSERRKFVFDSSNLSMNIIKNNEEYKLSTNLLDCDELEGFCEGDLIKVKLKDIAVPQMFTVGSKLEERWKPYQLYPVQSYNYSCLEGRVETIEVVRSGCTNQLNLNVGEFTTYGRKELSFFDEIKLGERERFVKDLNRVFDSREDTDLIFSSYNTPIIFIESYNSVFKGVRLSTGASEFKIRNLTNEGNIGADCDFNSYSYNSRFVLDDDYQVMMRTPENCLIPVCFKFPDLDFGMNKVDVISSSASVLSDDWNYDKEKYQLTSINPYETGEKGKWRTQSIYAYKEGIIHANTGIERNYKDAGVYPMYFFNYNSPELNDSKLWIKASEITKYSANGNAFESKNILGKYSIVKFGYNDNLVYLSAANANGNSIVFESFEKTYDNNMVEDGWQIDAGSITNQIAHSGKASCKINGSILSRSFTYDDRIDEGKLMAKFWIKSSEFEKLPIDVKINGNSGDVKQVAIVGEWQLIHADLTNALFGIALGQNFNIEIVNSNGTSENYIDDLRIAPKDAQMNSTVYDPTDFKVVASFDDQNFGLFYQYNTEGKLIRKLIETEKGIKTISETHYNIPKTGINGTK